MSEIKVHLTDKVVNETYLIVFSILMAVSIDWRQVFALSSHSNGSMLLRLSALKYFRLDGKIIESWNT